MAAGSDAQPADGLGARHRWNLPSKVPAGESVVSQGKRATTGEEGFGGAPGWWSPCGDDYAQRAGGKPERRDCRVPQLHSLRPDRLPDLTLDAACRRSAESLIEVPSSAGLVRLAV